MPRDRRYPPQKPRVYRFVRATFRTLYDVAGRRHVSGLENVPERGPFIVVNNHLSYADLPLMGAEFPHLAQPFAAEKYRNHILFRPILDVGGAIFVERGEVDRNALRQALDVLADGGIMALAIEGTRSKTGGLLPGKSGAAYLATRANVPLLPVVMYGTEQVIPNLLRLRRTDVYIAFGPLIHLPEGRASTQQLEEYTDKIMVTMAAMLPEPYRGVYANHPLLHKRLASIPSF